MKNLRKHQLIAIGSSIAVLYGVLCLVAFASAASRTEKPAPVDAEQFADFMGHEVLDIQDLAEGAEVQRRMFNRITPPGLSWIQPMFPPVAPFDAENFDERFLSELLGEEKNSVAIYPLSLIQNPKTRETLIYNAEGELIAAIPADRGSREWPADADPSRVILQLGLLPAEDVEPYLYTERRIEESLARYNAPRSAKSGGAATRGLEAGEFGICGIQGTTNGTMFITVTNGANVAEVFAYTVWHTSSVVVATWTNEQSNVVTDTNTVWHQVSPAFNGLESAWECLTTNLVLTNGVGIYEDANISSNARIRFYAVANRQDSDGDGLTDGMEIFVHHTNPQSIDTDGDGLLDGYDIPVWIGDPRYTAWANNIVFTSSEGLRIFKGELSAGSDPLADDTDSDGLPDGWEVKNALDPLDAEGENGAEGDPDGDGFDNALELELGAPANNSAWNGEQLAYRLTHVTPVIVTNARSITTNWIGLRVDIDDSIDCGGTAGTQDKRKPLDIPKLLDCGYFIDIRVHGMVEDVDVNYDKVSIEAFTNTFYFSGSYNRPRDCRMIPKTKTCNVLIMGNSTAYLRYNTVSYKWHSGAYAEIISATNTAPYKVVVSGEDAMCIGETISVTASGGSESNYTWFGYGGVSLSGTTSNSTLVTGVAPGFASVSATDSKGCTGVKEIIVLQPDIGKASPLADRTLHPDAARKPLVLRQTLPGAWHGQMQLNLTGAVAYWTPTGGVPIALSSTFFANEQLPRTIYLEGGGCGIGEASFSIAGSGGCEANTPLQIFGANATLAGVAEADEESPGGFIADRTVHTNAPRTMLTLTACGPYGSPGNLILTWDSSVVKIYTAPSGGTALTQFVTPFHGFNGTNLYVEGISPGTTTLNWTYSAQSNCTDSIQVSVIKVGTETIATTPSDRTRTKIGIGEEVVCSIAPSMSVNWSVTGGGTVSVATGASTTFTASKSPSSSTVHAQIAGADCTVTFMVVAPDGMMTSLVSDGNLGSLGMNNIGAKSFFNCYVLPNDVSFYNVEFRENIPGETYTWPDGTGGRRPSAIVHWSVGFDNKTTDIVSSGLAPVARIFDGTNYVDFTFGVRVPEEYKNEAGTWVEWLPDENHPRNYRGSDRKARVKLEASNTAIGGWMGPWQ